MENDNLRMQLTLENDKRCLMISRYAGYLYGEKEIRDKRMIKFFIESEIERLNLALKQLDDIKKMSEEL